MTLPRDGREFSAEGAWTFLTDAVERHAPADRLITIHHSDLLHQPGAVVDRLIAWAGIPVDRRPS